MSAKSRKIPPNPLFLFHSFWINTGADINMVVRDKDVCGYCRGDIAAAANAAEVNSLTIHAVDKYGDPVKYTWETGMKSIKVAK
ncbi:cytidine deaminase-like fold-containing protein [Yersinia enterocolitica]|uniref:cytidine deaminase-like fold-containing protein n=1 Tax=Yersinia enterocolitica TaxID=630 RepID=UPI003D0714F0